MIKPNRSNDTHIRIKDIDRIESSSQSHLQQGNRHPLAAKDPQRSERREFKIAERNLSADSIDFAEGFADELIITG